jgi:2-hydroxy-3-keto-5-methylthiopentenyl-1-phosphate phosphatase
MTLVRSVLVDFDGTACTHDVAEHLMERFGEPEWREWDERWIRREVDTRSAIRGQVAPFRGLHDELIAYAVSHCPLDPTFPAFARWCRDRDIAVTIVSDGLGLYIQPILAANGVSDVSIVTNDWAGGALAFPNGHPRCDWCGTCKMLAVQRAPAPVAFVGEGHSDRYGALYADIVFAKDELVQLCADDGVPFLPYGNFDDVRRELERATSLPGALAPELCPGWHVPWICGDLDP